MTNSKRLLCILGLLVLAAIFYYLGRPAPQEQKTTAGDSSNQKQESLTKKNPLPTTSRAEQLRSRTASPDKNLDPRVARYTDGSVDLVDAIVLSGQLHQSSDPLHDLEVVAQLFVQYRLIYQTNPVGTDNFEFTNALTGSNAKKVNFIDPDSPALSPTNELVDRWGSPFRFHPLSQTEIEVLSLGPDKTLWTEDDLTLEN